MSSVRIRVLGPIELEVNGHPIALTKPRHRELLGILVASRGRRISTGDLIDELWDEAPATAVGAIRTFIAELRKLIEPDRQPRAAPTVLVTIDDGYALLLDERAVDAWRAEKDAARAELVSPAEAERLLSAARREWRGAAYDEFADREWSKAERRRLAELRARVEERLAGVRIGLGRASEVVSLLDAHVTAHPWREEAWRLLALALYRSSRQVEALEILRTARRRLADELGLSPTSALSELEGQILRQDPTLYQSSDRGIEVAEAFTRVGDRARLEATNAVLASLAVSGDLGAVRRLRREAIASAEQLGDPELTARVIGGFDVPGVWTRSDDTEDAAAMVAAAERALDLLDKSESAGERTRARLLATIALESRGTAAHAAEAREALAIARRLGDPLLLCTALSARFMQEFSRTGLAPERVAIADELIATARAAESSTFEITGRLTRMQALCALGDLEGAAAEADAVDRLAAVHERPLVSVFTRWFRRTFRGVETELPLPVEMPGFTAGIAALDSLCRAVRNDTVLVDRDFGPRDFGPYEKWVRPLLLAADSRLDEAAKALARVPDPPRDLLQEVLWCLLGHAALRIGDAAAKQRVALALAPARHESAAGSGVIDLGPVRPLYEALLA